MSKNTEDFIVKLIQQALELPEGAVSLESLSDQVPGWDSLGHLAILSNLDQHFDGKVASIEELATVNNVKDIIKILKQNELI